MKHTPTPWKIGFNEYDVCNNKAIICECMGLKEGKENAKFIVKAVNNHERLLEALKELMETIQYKEIKGFRPSTLVKTVEAIKQAESEE